MTINKAINFISRIPLAVFHETSAQLAMKQQLNSYESQFRILYNEWKFDTVILSWIIYKYPKIQ